MKLLCLTEGETIPATRFRVGQFLPAWRRRGIQVRVEYGYGSRYNALASTRLGTPYKVAGKLRRLLGLRAVRGADAVLCQRLAIPQTALPERIARRLNPNIILDIDDHPYMWPGGRHDPARERAFTRVVALSDQIVCGNQYLAQLVGAPVRVSVIPTVIDTDTYVPLHDTSPEMDIVRIGWMGTAGNFYHLSPLTEALQEMLGRHPKVRLRLVSNAPFEPLLGHPQVEQIPWSKERERELLASFDVGLMPLRDSEVARGKCGFKMIQYMAMGVPVVSSSVGANRDIFQGSEAGLLVDETSHWAAALEAALSWSPHERSERGRRGREHVVARYSIHSVLPAYDAIFARYTRSTSPEDE